MDNSFWLALVAKMVTSALLVVIAARVVERTGPVLGGMVATLPVSAGPAYAFLAMDHGAAFIADTSLTSLGALTATAPYVASYAALAQRHGPIISVGIAALIWLAVSVLANSVAWNWWAALGLNLLGFGGGVFFCRRYLHARAAGAATSRPWDLPVRAAAVMLSVAAVVFSGRLLGPTAAGILAMLPVVFTCLAVLLHPRLGGPATAAVIAHALPGMVGFSVALAVIHLAAVPLGSTTALLLALAVCIGWNGALLLRSRLIA